MQGGEVLDRLLSEGVFIPLLIASTVVLTILIRSAAGVVRSAAREKSRREIAAYIAEGSMSAEQGERLMKAGRDCD